MKVTHIVHFFCFVASAGDLRPKTKLFASLYVDVAIKKEVMSWHLLFLICDNDKNQNRDISFLVLNKIYKCESEIEYYS